MAEDDELVAEGVLGGADAEVELGGGGVAVLGGEAGLAGGGGGEVVSHGGAGAVGGLGVEGPGRVGEGRSCRWRAGYGSLLFVNLNQLDGAVY